MDNGFITITHMEAVMTTLVMSSLQQNALSLLQNPRSQQESKMWSEGLMR
jgi:hypothetical protein